MADRETLKRCILVRHAESAANAGDQTAEPSTIPLSARGFAQAAALAQLWEQPPELLVMSPFLRTQQTAQPTRNRFPTVWCEQWDVQEFTYLDLTLSRDTTAAQRQPLVAAFWERADPFHVDGPGAEPFAAFAARIAHFLDQAAAATPRDLLIFTHGQFMNLVRWQVAHPDRAPAQHMAEWRAWALPRSIPNAARLELHLTPQGWREHSLTPLPEA